MGSDMLLPDRFTGQCIWFRYSPSSKSIFSILRFCQSFFLHWYRDEHKDPEVYLLNNCSLHKVAFTRTYGYKGKETKTVYVFDLEKREEERQYEVGPRKTVGLLPVSPPQRVEILE